MADKNSKDHMETVDKFVESFKKNEIKDREDAKKEREYKRSNKYLFNL